MGTIGPSEPAGAAPRRGTAPGRRDERAAPREAEAGDAERLARLLRRHKDGRDQGGEDESRQDQPPPFAMPPGSLPGEAVLAGMGAKPVEAADGVENAARREALAKLVDSVVDRVLVSGQAAGTAVLHASVQSDALGGAVQVEIARAAQGLEVRIEAQGMDGQQLLRDRGAELAAQLADRLGERVVLQVPAATGGEGAGAEDERQRRSRGYEAMLSYAAG
ncbi:hypothetical protein JMJ56_18590 [Belnapia sp. T18]|uniref:Flagellar hook-length control protein FliK n=1 Tax=Belnapia arida TaxID=2804533 RepID=A0ABS1U5V0_9PROT|nr:hypothetical protein [Belnapia arida]MBL6080033.1 hypothetical protein [Belnapia arida]